MGFAFSKLWEGLFAADDNFKVRPSQKLLWGSRWWEGGSASGRA